MGRIAAQEDTPIAILGQEGRSDSFFDYDNGCVSNTENRRRVLQQGISLTIKSTIPLRLGKFNLVGSHMVLDGLLRQRRRYLAFQKHIKPAEVPLAGNPRHARLAIELKRNNLRAPWKIGLDKGVQNRPEHLGLGPRKRCPHRLADHGPGSVRAQGILAVNLAPRARLDVNANRVFNDGRDFLAVVDIIAELLVEHPFDDGLANHEEVLVQRVLQTHPPLVLPGYELAITKGRAGCGTLDH
jgi:hypothetical protein